MVPVRWLLALLGLFVIAASFDFYLSRSSTRHADAAGQRLEVADSFAAARSGELSDGRIVSDATNERKLRAAELSW